MECIPKGVINGIGDQITAVTMEKVTGDMLQEPKVLKNVTLIADPHCNETE